MSSIFAICIFAALIVYVVLHAKKKIEEEETEKQIMNRQYEEERQNAIHRISAQSSAPTQMPKVQTIQPQKENNQRTAEAYYALGEAHYNGLPISREKAAEYYLQAYESGNVTAAYDLGYMYINGDGVSEDVQKGIKYFEEAAQNHARANWQLGRLYYYGEKVEKNAELSFQYALKAADLGDTDAMVHVAKLYEIKALGAPYRDHELSKKYYEQAIAKGDRNAPWNLGANYYFGLSGYEKDAERGFNYFKQAAERGSIAGQLSLALCYLREDTVEKDLTEAKDWLEKAKENGSVEAKGRLGILLASGLMESTEETIRQGKQMLQDAYADNGEDEVAAEAVQYVCDCEEKYGSLGLIPVECQAELLRLCQENYSMEKRELKLDDSLKQGDVCIRPLLCFKMLEVYSDAKFNMWRLCYEEAEKLLQAAEDLNFPDEEDLVKQRKLYGYLAVASYKMAVMYGAHTFFEVEEYFNKALPFSEDEEGQFLASFYQEFRSRKQKPAQERGLVGKVDMLLYQDDTDAVFGIIDDLSREQWFELNVESRLWLGKVLLLGDDMSEAGIELLASVAEENLGSLNPYPAKAIVAIMEHYQKKYVETGDFECDIKTHEWGAVLVSKVGAENALETLKQYGEMYQDVIETIQEFKEDGQKQQEADPELEERVVSEQELTRTQESGQIGINSAKKTILEQIKEAKEMLDCDIITEEEFQEIKTKLIAKS